MQKYKSREDVPLKYRWDLTEYYKDDKAFTNHDKQYDEHNHVGVPARTSGNGYRKQHDDCYRNSYIHIVIGGGASEEHLAEIGILMFIEKQAKGIERTVRRCPSQSLYGKQ